MSGENGDKSQRQTSEEIEHHIDIILLLHQSCPSFIKVEKVVNPPQNPVVSSSLADGDIHPPSRQFNPERNPMMRHPATFTAIVPNGKAITVQDCTIFDTQYLMPPRRSCQCLLSIFLSSPYIIYV